MSDYMALAGISLTLKTLLDDRLAYADPALPTEERAAVTISAPGVSHSRSTPRLNLFLYQVTENQHLKNQEIPGRETRGAYGTPPLSLDLHFLLTAYGRSETDETEAQQLLGDAMRVLHDTPVISESLLQTRDTAPHQPVLDLALRGQFESVKVYLEPLDMEALARVWTALATSYRLSVGYVVSVVQIESQRTKPQPLPVKERRVFGVPLQRPLISTIAPLWAAIGESITLTGSSLAGENARVRMAGVEVAISPPTSSQITFTLPDDPALQPGPLAVEVLSGLAELPQAAVRSNQAVFMLVPRVTGISPTSGPVGTSLTITGDRIYTEGAPNLVLLGDQAFTPDPATSATGSLQIPISGLGPGTYRVRVRVNGAESREESFQFEVTP